MFLPQHPTPEVATLQEKVENAASLGVCDISLQSNGGTVHTMNGLKKFGMLAPSEE